MASSIDFPDIRCMTCGFVIATKYDIYRELLAIGYSGEQAFQVINVKRHCCRMRIANSPVINSIYIEEPDSLIGAKSEALPQESIVSTVKENLIMDSNLKYVVETLRKRRTIDSEISAIKERENIRSKDKMKEELGDVAIFDLQGNPYGEVSKETPSNQITDEEAKSAWNLNGVGIPIPSLGEGNEVVEMVDVGGGFQVPRLGRVIHLNERLPVNLKQEMNDDEESELAFRKWSEKEGKKGGKKEVVESSKSVKKFQPKSGSIFAAPKRRKRATAAAPPP